MGLTENRTQGGTPHPAPTVKTVGPPTSQMVYFVDSEIYQSIWVGYYRWFSIEFMYILFDIFQ